MKQKQTRQLKVVKKQPNKWLLIGILIFYITIDVLLINYIIIPAYSHFQEVKEEKEYKEILKTAKAHTFPYHHYTREEINSLNVVNLVELCVYLFESKLTYTAGRLVLRYHPHVIVYAEGFYDTKTIYRVKGE